MTGRPVVIKLGGRSIEPDAIAPVALDIARLSNSGHRVFMVHGGGPQATELQKRLGQTPNIVAGRRITDEAALEVMKMAVAGQLNVDLCAALLAAGARPVGLSGASSLAIEAVLRPPRVVSGGGPDPIDFGRVGDVVDFNGELLDLLADRGYVPVLACLGADGQGNVLNINADIVANKLAEKVRAAHLVLITSVPGVLRDTADANSRIASLTAAEARSAIASGEIAGGMIPKIEESLAVLATGAVGSIHIVGQLAAGQLQTAIEKPGQVGTTLLP